MKKFMLVALLATLFASAAPCAMAASMCFGPRPSSNQR